MGKGIIHNLLKKGHPVLVFAHRDGLNLDDLKTAGGKVTTSLDEVGRACSRVILCVPSSKEVEAAILGPHGLIENMKEGSIIVDLSTSHPASTRMLAERLAARRIEFLDAPMTGSAAQANSGELNLMVGGKKEVYEQCLPIFRAIAKHIFHVGPTSHGNMVKLINNFLGQLTNAGLAEILPLAAKAGIDFKALYDVVQVSGGYSRAFEGAVPSICKRDFRVSFEIRLAHKDMAYVSSVGRELNMPLPMVNSLLNVLDIAKASGLGRENTNALVKLWEKVGNVEVRRAW